MDKPLNILIEEGRINIAQAISNTKLPSYLLEPILKDIYNEIVFIKNEELRKAKKEYEESLKKEIAHKEKITQNKGEI